jgi:hypothetical protein
VFSQHLPPYLPNTDTTCPENMVWWNVVYTTNSRCLTVPCQVARNAHHSARRQVARRVGKSSSVKNPHLERTGTVQTRPRLVFGRRPLLIWAGKPAILSFFVVFSVPPWKCRYRTSTRTRPILPNSLQFIGHPTSWHYGHHLRPMGPEVPTAMNISLTFM